MDAGVQTAPHQANDPLQEEKAKGYGHRSGRCSDQINILLVRNDESRAEAVA
jgi:hypothetical protein